MNRRIKPILILSIIIGQILVSRYVNITGFNVDLPFLIIVYFALRSSLTKTLIWGSVIGWITDAYTGGVMGLFGFSRTIAALILHQLQRFLDLTRIVFVFFLIFLSAFISNLIANLFFNIIMQTPMNFAFLFRQPVLTALVGALAFKLPGVREMVHVD